MPKRPTRPIGAGRPSWALVAALGVLASIVPLAGCGRSTRSTTTSTTAFTPTPSPASTSTSITATTASTPVPVGGPSLAIAGDIACAPGVAPSASQCQQGATADLVASLHPDAVVAVGDLQYEAGARSAFDASYGPSWGRFRDLTHPAVGNHEYGTSSAAGYFGYWGDRAGPAKKGWYSWDLGGWHLVALNSNCSVVGCGPGSEQLAWLESDLQRSTARCTLAYWHHPRWSSGLHGDDASVDPLWQALVAAHADVVVSGHDHHYERFAPRDGLRQFVAGTGGRNLYPVLKRTPGSEAVDVGFGVLRLTLGPTSYSWEFHPLAGGIGDSGTTACT